mgnify:CR=1 FL=1
MMQIMTLDVVPLCECTSQISFFIFYSFWWVKITTVSCSTLARCVLITFFYLSQPSTSWRIRTLTLKQRAGPGWSEMIFEMKALRSSTRREKSSLRLSDALDESQRGRQRRERACVRAPLLMGRRETTVPSTSSRRRLMRYMSSRHPCCSPPSPAPGGTCWLSDPTDLLGLLGGAFLRAWIGDWEPGLFFLVEGNQGLVEGVCTKLVYFLWYFL